MKSRGFFFEADFFVALALFFTCTILIFSQLNQAIKNVSAAQKESELAQAGIFLTDSIIKNRDENFPVLGAAFFNKELKRVEQNTIDLDLLRKTTKDPGFLGFFLKSIYVKYKDFQKEKIFDLETNRNCLIFERFVLIKNKSSEKKGKIVVEVCNG